AQVGRERVPPRGVEYGGMRVWSALPLRIAAFPAMLRDVAGFAQGPAGENRIDHYAAAAVIGRQDEFARRMNRDMAGHAGRMLFVELPQIARLLVYRERGHASAFLARELSAFIGGV